MSKRIGEWRGHLVAAGALISALAQAVAADPVWSGFAGDAQHSAISSIPSDPLSQIRWQTPVDLDPQYSGNDLLIHYGSPLVTGSNTVIVPVKTGAQDGFEVEGLSGASGSAIWSASSDYALPPLNGGWTPSYNPALTPTGGLYYPGAGGTVFLRQSADSPASTTQRIAFFGNSNYNANPAGYNQNVFINTPITGDSAGNIYFGFRVTGPSPLGAGVSGGIARIAANGTATWTSASAADPTNSSVSSPVMNCAPAISPDGRTLYIALNNGAAPLSATGDLVALNAATLAPMAAVHLIDPHSGNPAWLPDIGTASPTVASNGEVYFGVLENPLFANNDRGWLLHFSANLPASERRALLGGTIPPPLSRPRWFIPITAHRATCS